MRRAVSTMVSLIAVASAQSPPRAFEAASIKPSREAIGSSGWDSHPGSIVLRGKTLKGLIAIAYKVKDTQIVDGPKWLDASRFDINARASAPAGDDQLLVMLQGLLAERFQLVMRIETRTATGYALVIAKGGLKIQPVQPRKESHNNYGRGRISARGITMAALAEALSRLIENPVSDRTSAPGVFDFQLEWPTEGDATEATSALSSVLREQLGLNLEIRKLAVDLLVVERAETPVFD